MRKFKMLFLTSFSVLSLFFVDINVHGETTHLKVHPGKIKIDGIVESGTNKHLYKYYVENDSERDQKVSIVPSGYIKSKTNEVTIRKGERKYFDVNLEIPHDAFPGKKIDYLIVKSVSDDNSYTIKLSAKVEYEVSKSDQYPNYKNYYFILLIMGGLIILSFMVKKVRNSKSD